MHILSSNSAVCALLIATLFPVPGVLSQAAPSAKTPNTNPSVKEELDGSVSEVKRSIQDAMSIKGYKLLRQSPSVLYFSRKLSRSELAPYVLAGKQLSKVPQKTIVVVVNQRGTKTTLKAEDQINVDPTLKRSAADLKSESDDFKSEMNEVFDAVKKSVAEAAAKRPAEQQNHPDWPTGSGGEF